MLEEIQTILSCSLFLILNSVNFMLESLKDLIKFLNQNIYGVVFLCLTLYFLFIYRWPCKLYHNYKMIKCYKREKSNNSEKYITQRRFEDGGIFENSSEKRGEEKLRDYRDYIYLVNKKDKKYQRIVDLYTLGQLGYSRPSREDNKCFKISDGYTLGDEIKIYNIISDIKDILKLKNEIK